MTLAAQPSSSGPEAFRSTQWSMVLAAGGESPDSRRALAELCRVYWYPVYAYIRRRTASVQDAPDLTQAFFARVLEKNYFAQADRKRGRFRAFLLTAVQHFLSHERERAAAQKRGGGRAMLSLDFANGEARYALEPADDVTPERLFDRQWATALLEQVEALLRQEFADAGQATQYELLQPLMTRAAATSYHDVGLAWGMSEGAVKTAVYRMRLRFRELLRAEIAGTLTDAQAIDDEIRDLFALLGE